MEDLSDYKREVVKAKKDFDLTDFEALQLILIKEQNFILSTGLIRSSDQTPWLEIMVDPAFKYDPNA